MSVVYVFCLCEAIFAGKTLTDQIEYNEFFLIVWPIRQCASKQWGPIHFLSRVILFKSGFFSEMFLKTILSQIIQFMHIREIFQISQFRINMD